MRRNTLLRGIVVTAPSVFGGLYIGECDVGTNDRARNSREEQKAAARKGGGGEAEWRGYVNVELSASQKAQFDDWAATGTPWDVLEEVGGAGVVVTVKVEKGGQGFIASATQRDAASLNAGLCVTARAKSAGKGFHASVVHTRCDWCVW